MLVLLFMKIFFFNPSVPPSSFVLSKFRLIISTNLSACRFDWGWYGWERICSIVGFLQSNSANREVDCIRFRAQSFQSGHDYRICCREHRLSMAVVLVNDNINNFWPFEVRVNQPTNQKLISHFIATFPNGIWSGSILWRVSVCLCLVKRMSDWFSFFVLLCEKWCVRWSNRRRNVFGM